MLVPPPTEECDDLETPPVRLRDVCSVCTDSKTAYIIESVLIMLYRVSRSRCG